MAISWDIRSITGKCVRSSDESMNYGQHYLNANASFPVVINSSQASHLSCGRMFSTVSELIYSPQPHDSHFISWYLGSLLRQLDWNGVSISVVSSTTSFLVGLLCCFSCLYQVETGWCNSSLRAFQIQTRFTERRFTALLCSLLKLYNYRIKSRGYLVRNVSGSVTEISEDLVCVGKFELSQRLSCLKTLMA